MEDIILLESKIDKAKKSVEKNRWIREYLQKDLTMYINDLANENESIEIFDKSKLFLQAISESARNIARVRIEEIVTSALQYVFGKNYSFKITVRNTSSGKPETDFLVCTVSNNTIIESTPSLSKGGGVVDLLAIALKFAILELIDYDGFIWMDEPFKHLSKRYRPLVGKLLKFMQETGGRQLIIITHSAELAEVCEKVLTVRQIQGISKIVHNA